MFHAHGSNTFASKQISSSNANVSPGRIRLASRHRAAAWIPVLATTAILTAALLSNPLHAQTVTINDDGVHTDGKPILLTAPPVNGKAKHVHLTIVNQRGANVCYQFHLRERVSFVSFHGDNDSRDITLPFADNLNTADKRRDVFSVYLAKQKVGQAGVYHDEVGVEVWDLTTNKRLGYAEVRIAATVRTQRGFPRRRPEGYAMWTNDSGQLQRVRLTDLPLRVYSNDPEQARIVHRATSVWNEAGRSVGLTKSFFLHVADRGAADMTIDWSGRDLPSDAAGAAALQVSPSETVIAGIVMRRGADEAKIAETLVQELGHILGLDHSSVSDDIMAPTVHRHWHDSLRFVVVTERDLSALWWLYQQPRFVPIVAARSTNR